MRHSRRVMGLPVQSAAGGMLRLIVKILPHPGDRGWRELADPQMTDDLLAGVPPGASPSRGTN